MKSVVIAALAFLIGTAALAADPGSKVVVVNQKKAGSYKVIYNGTEDAVVTFTISDRRGIVVYTETIESKKGFVRPVNFSGMLPGEYTIAVSDKTGKVSQTVQYAYETSIRNVHVAKVDEQGKYMLAIANDGAEVINVRIYDGNSNLVFEKSHNIEGNFGLVYNLKQVEGKPTFEITDNNGTTKVIKY
ncbi:MAG: hypothetical protein U0V64_01465 [Cyclobacteriaceae bacterium]